VEIDHPVGHDLPGLELAIPFSVERGAVHSYARYGIVICRPNGRARGRQARR
jgi:hypothetical protein